MRNIMKKRIIPMLIVASLFTALAACGGGKTTVNSDGTKTVQTEKGVKITETAAKAAQTELYECADF
ncbi:MAG: hypothetical protein ACI4I0_08070, partial [Acutalibacteraceae bacterium]